MYKTEKKIKEICKNLDEQHEKYLAWELKTYTAEEILENFVSRKNISLIKK